jgi:hypothetical protein
MPTQVKLAPSVRLALRQCTAKDGGPFSDPAKDQYMIQRDREEIALLSCANLSAGMGKFWASDSESECEDLGDAEPLHTDCRKTAAAATSCPLLFVLVLGVLPFTRRHHV